jgi:hypothetical protein
MMDSSPSSDFHGFRVGPCGRAAPPVATSRRPVGATERLSDAPPGLTAEKRRREMGGCVPSPTTRREPLGRATPSWTWLERSPPRRGQAGEVAKSCKSNVHSDPAPALTRVGGPPVWGRDDPMDITFTGLRLGGASRRRLLAPPPGLGGMRHGRIL